MARLFVILYFVLGFGVLLAVLNIYGVIGAIAIYFIGKFLYGDKWLLDKWISKQWNK